MTALKMENETDFSTQGITRNESKVKQRQLTYRIVMLTSLLFFAIILSSNKNLEELGFVVKA